MMSCRPCMDEVACNVHAAGHEAPLPSPVDDLSPAAAELPKSIEYLRQLYDAANNDLGRKLIDAGQAGDAVAVMELLQQGSRLCELPDFGEGLLFLACLAGHLELVKALLTMQENNLAHNNKCISMALIKAACGDHTDIVRLLILHSAEVNSRSPEGQLEVIKALVEASANRENSKEEMQTALLEAAMDGHTAVARLLIDHGAQVNMPAQCQESPLLLAACGGHVEVASLFIERGALIEEGNGDGSTPLMEAAREGRDDVVALLVAHGADVNAQCASGETPLTIACMSGFTDVVDILVQAGANLEYETGDRMTPLMKAAHAGHHGVVQHLLLRGASVNKCSLVNGHTALSLACTAGHLDVAELLLSYRANAEHKLTDGSSALMEAIKGNHTAVVNLLLEYPNVPLVSVPPPRVAAAPAPTANQSPAFSEESDKDSSEEEDDDQECDSPICVDDDEVSDYFDQIITTLISLVEESVDALDSMSTAIRAAGQEVLEKLRCHKRTGLAISARDCCATTTQQASVLLAAKLDPARAIGDQPLNDEAAMMQLLVELREQPYVSTACGGFLPSTLEYSTCATDKVTYTGGSKASSGVRAACEQHLLRAPTTLGELMAHHIQNSTVGAGAMLPPLGNQDALTPSCVPDVCSTSKGSKSNRSHTCDGSGTSLLGLQTGDLTKMAQAAQLARLGAPGPVTSKGTEDFSLSAAKLPTVQQLPQQQQGKATCSAPCKNSCQHAQQPATAAVSCAKPAQCSHSQAPGEPGANGVSQPRRAVAVQGVASQTKPLVDVNTSAGSNSDSPLTVACAGGNVDLVRRLLEKKADIEHKDKKGFTPLLLAASAGHVGVIKLLLDSGANIEATTEKGKDSALGLAASSGRIEAAEVLVHRGANKEHRNASDYTPLSIAAGSGSLDMIRLLLAHGSEINSSTWTPETCGHLPKPNHKRQQKKAPKACLPGDPLCRQSAGKLGITPMMAAAMHGHVGAAKLLIENGCDINLQLETTRNTALSLACIQRHHEVVRLLLDYSADVEHRSKNGLTPLMEAATNGSVEVGRVLIESGADVNAAPVPTSKETALTIAADKGHNEFVKLLIGAKALLNVKNKKGCSPLWLACNGGHLSVVQSLCDAKADLESCDNRFVSCLMAAFKQGHVKVVKWLAKLVSQFPSDGECNRYLAAAADKEDLYKNCQQCMEIIMAAKEKQGAEANRHAITLLKEIEAERCRDEKRSKAAAEKRDKKKQGKPTDKPTILNDQAVNGDLPATGGDDDKRQQQLRQPPQQPPPSQQPTSAAARQQPTLSSTRQQPAPSSAQQQQDTSGKTSLQPAAATALVESLATTSQPCSAQPMLPKNKVLDLSSIERPSPAAASAAAAAPSDAKNPAEVWLPVKKSSHSRNQPAPGKAPATSASQPAAAAARTAAAGGRGAAVAPSPKKAQRDEWKEVVRGNSKKILVPPSAAAVLLSSQSLATIREWSRAGIELCGGAVAAAAAAATADRVVVLSGSSKAIRRAQSVFTALSQNPSLTLESQLRKRKSRRRPASASATAAAAAAAQLGSQPQQQSWSLATDEDDMLVIPSATVVPFPVQPSSSQAQHPPSGKPTYSTVTAAGVRPVAASAAAWQLKWGAPPVATTASTPAASASGAAISSTSAQPTISAAEPVSSVPVSGTQPSQRWNVVVAGTGAGASSTVPAASSASSTTSSSRSTSVTSSPQLSPRCRSREPPTPAVAAAVQLPAALPTEAATSGARIHSSSSSSSSSSEPAELVPPSSAAATGRREQPTQLLDLRAEGSVDDLPASAAALECSLATMPPSPELRDPLRDMLLEQSVGGNYFGGSLARSMMLPWLAPAPMSATGGSSSSEIAGESKTYARPASGGVDPAKAPGFRPQRQLQPTKLFASTMTTSAVPMAATYTAATPTSASSYPTGTETESFAKAAYALLNGYGAVDQSAAGSAHSTSLMFSRYGGGSVGPTSLSERDIFLGAGVGVVDASGTAAVRGTRERPPASNAAAADANSIVAAGQSAFSSKLNPNASEFRSSWSSGALSYEPDFGSERLYQHQHWPAREPGIVGLPERSPPSSYSVRSAAAASLLGSSSSSHSAAAGLVVSSPSSVAGRPAGRSDAAAHLPVHASYSYGIIGTERAQRRLAMSRGNDASCGDSPLLQQHRVSYSDLGFPANGSGDVFMQPLTNGPGLPNPVVAPAAARNSTWTSASGGSEWWGTIGEPLSANIVPPTSASGLRPGLSASLRNDYSTTAEQSRKVDSLLLGAPLQFNATPNPMYAMTGSRGAGFGPTADQWNSLPPFAWDRTTPSSSR